MKSFLSYIVVTLLFVAGKNNVHAQEQDSIWQKLKPYFSPPPKYASGFGKYRTPLKFYDGSPVKTLSDWKDRRKEIINRWQELMGPWPEWFKRFY
jgi:hypothetical protein